MKTWLLNNWGYFALLASLALNFYLLSGKSNFSSKKIEDNNAIIEKAQAEREDIRTLTIPEIRIIQNSIENKQTIIKKTKPAEDEEILNYYNANDSVQFLDWARHAICFKSAKLLE